MYRIRRNPVQFSKIAKSSEISAGFEENFPENVRELVLAFDFTHNNGKFVRYDFLVLRKHRYEKIFTWTFFFLASILSANAAGVQNPPAAVDTVLVNDLGTYKGEYPVGKGVLFSDTWGVIKGEFKDGLPHGRCVLHDYRPFRYVGQFSEGHITGYGQFFYDNGQVETGWYENGRASGVDTVYYRDGRVYIGLFENNKKVKGKGTEYEKMPDFLKGRKPQYHEPLLSVEELNFYNEVYEKLTADDHKPTFQGQNMNTFAK